MLSGLIATLLPTAVFAQHGHSTGADTSDAMMIPWLHFEMGDTLLFQGWTPADGRVLFGACVGLFLLAIIERWVAAMRAIMEVWWKRKVEEILAKRFKALRDSPSEKADQRSARLPPPPRFSLRTAAPFIPSHDLSRGLLYAVNSALNFAIMLVVMTYNASFIISIIVGLFVGEVCFGRFAYGTSQH